MISLLWHKLRTAHTVYWLGNWAGLSHYGCECGRNFEVWTPRA